jgi:hypothetical protein
VLITRQQNVFAGFFRFFSRAFKGFHAVVDDDGTTPERRVCRFYAGRFMMGVAGALAGADAEPVSQPRGGAQPFWVGLFYTVNAIAGILVSLGWQNALTAGRSQTDYVLLPDGGG